MHPVSKKVFPLLIGTAVFVWCLRYILLNFQWAKILQVLNRVDLAWWLVIALSIPLYWLLRTLRWLVLLRSMHVNVGLLELYFCTSVSLSLALVTPLQSGEMLKVELLKKRGWLGRSPGYGSFLIERVLDFLMLATFATISVLSGIRLPSEINWTKMLVAFLALTVFVLAAGFVISKTKGLGKVGEFLTNMRASARNPKTLLFITLLTFLSWMTVAIGWHLCFTSISLGISFRQSIALMAIVTFVNVLSFIPGGIGVAEVSITELLRGWHLDVGLAQAGAVLLRCYAVLILLMGAVHFLAWKMWESKNARPSGTAAQRPSGPESDIMSPERRWRG
jgi:uncharacterized protein (TIRG00374 family)